MDISPEKLRFLVFKAEQAHKIALSSDPDAAQNVAEARRALLQLQCMLRFYAAQSPEHLYYTASLLDDCTSKMQSLRIHASKSESRLGLLVRFYSPTATEQVTSKKYGIEVTLCRKQRTAELLAKAGCPPDFKFRNPQVGSSFVR